MGIKEEKRPTLLSVAVEPVADEAMAACSLAFARGREVCDAMIDLISRLPSAGHHLDSTNPPEYVIRSAEPIGRGLPVVVMHYRLEPDGATITLLKVRYHDA